MKFLILPYNSDLLMLINFRIIITKENMKK